MTAIRTTDAAFLNEVANHPEVRPWLLGPDGPLDLTEAVADPRNIALQFEHGGFIFTNADAAFYEVHSLFLPDKGTGAIRAMRKAAQFMFTATNCMEICTKLPEGNKAAKGLAQLAGFEVVGSRPGMEYASLRFDRWRSRSAECLKAGHEFHALLEGAKAAAGSSLAIHDDDEFHDRAVGAAILMCRAGQVAKGVWSYNRWALMAGYRPALVLSTEPPVVDVIDAVVTLNDGQLEVLECR